MKKFFLGAMLLALSATGVVKANYGNYNNCCPNECSYNWCGFYFGVNAGYAWGNSDAQASTEFEPRPLKGTGYFFSDDVPLVNKAGKQNLDPKGFIGGVQAGYNFQWCSFLLGLETDFNGFVLRGEDQVITNYPDSVDSFSITETVSTNWLYTLRGRLGWTCNNWLIFGSGGLAVTDLQYNAVFHDGFARGKTSGSETKTGWTAGAGFEYALCRCWTFKAEYLYVNFNNVSSNSRINAPPQVFFPFADSEPPVFIATSNPFSQSGDLTANTFRIGINYKL